MRTKVLAAVCGATASAIMALAVSTATAGRFSLSSQNVRITFNDVEFAMATVTTDCRLTLEGSFHSRTSAKVLASLVGYITRVTTGQCTNANTILSETLPWHVRYEGFAGTLPEITSVVAKIAQSGCRVLTCLSRAGYLLRVVRDPVTGALTGVEIPLERNEGLPVDGVFCPSPRLHSLRSNGNGSFFVLGSTSRVTLTLI